MRRKKSREILTFIYIMKEIIDLGSQSIRFLRFKDKKDLLRGPARQLVCPLAGDLKDGYLSPQRKNQALELIEEEIKGLDGKKVYLYATSALREARDGGIFIEEIKEKLGINAEIISGQEEARLGRLGAKILVGHDDFALLDLGGGSTELVTRDEELSFPMGVVRYNEDVNLEDYYRDLPLANQELYGLGGSLSVFVSLKEGLKSYDRETINGKLISRQEIVSLTKKLQALDLEARKAYLGDFSKRAQTIISAGIILDYLLKRLDKNIIYCDYTALEAYAIDRKLV